MPDEPMSVSGIKREAPAPLLPEALDRCVNRASSRAFCGDFFEELSAATFNGKRLVTDCQKDVCPDIELIPDKHYLETKSVGNNGSAIVYTHRREKDLEFIRRNGVQLTYAFWNHSVAVEHIKYLSELRKALAESVTRVVLIPADFLHKQLAGRPTRVLNTKTKTPFGRLGYGTNGYGQGWSITYKELMSWATPVKSVLGLSVYGMPCRTFDIYHRETPETALPAIQSEEPASNPILLPERPPSEGNPAPLPVVYCHCPRCGWEPEPGTVFGGYTCPRCEVRFPSNES